jgi:hypothetical protein
MLMIAICEVPKPQPLTAAASSETAVSVLLVAAEAV